MHCPGRQRNLRPRAISLFGLSSPCQPAWAQCLSMDSRPAEPPCTCAALTRPHGPHTINPIHSSPRPGRGCLEDLLKRRYTGGRGLSTTKLLGRMIGQARRPRYVVIVFLYCRPSLFVLPRHAHLSCNIHYPPPPHTRLTILLCIPSLPCWHDHTFTIVIQHNHPTRPGVTLQHFLFALFLFCIFEKTH